MSNNPFNLPPPWNPGYALPQNVDDEGLERHAFTTAWAPRGSFDNPEVGTAGYAVPGYIKKEGYGRGAMVTRMAPRGSYFGPKVPHWLDRPSAQVVGRKRLPDGATQLKIQTMAGIEQTIGGAGFAPITAYGLNAARSLIDTVRMMPPDLRSQQLKRALDKIDPKLWAKAESGAEAEAKLGVPADIALERGLGAAMSYGLASELVGLAKGKRPPERSQLGACLPCAAAMLGATEVVPGHWERARTGQVCPPPPGVIARPGYCWIPEATRVITPEMIAREKALADKLAAEAAAEAKAKAEQKFAQIGPFLIPTNVAQYADHRPLTGDKKAFVDENVAIAAKAGGISIAEMATGKYPFVRFKGGASGQEYWGLYYRVKDGKTSVTYRMIPQDKVGSLGGTQEALGWNPISSIGGAVSDATSAVGGAIKDVAQAVGGAIWDVMKKVWKGIKWVTMKVVHFVVDAAKWVAKQTCKLVSYPGVVQGAQAVATAAPNPYTVGIAAGVTVTKMICDQVAGSAEEKAAAAAAAQAEAEAAAAMAAAAKAEAEAAAARKKMMPILLLGGAGVLGAILLLGKKK